MTEVGRAYLERGKALLADFATAEASATEAQAAPRGTLRVTAPVVFGAHALAPLLGELAETYPELHVQLTLQDRVVDLVEEGFDVALRSGPLANTGFIARPLEPLHMLLCASPAYLRRRGAPRRPTDLERHECLGFMYLAHPNRWRLLGRDGEHVVARRAGARAARLCAALAPGAHRVSAGPLAFSEIATLRGVRAATARAAGVGSASACSRTSRTGKTRKAMIAMATSRSLACTASRCRCKSRSSLTYASTSTRMIRGANFAGTARSICRSVPWCSTPSGPAIITAQAGLSATRLQRTDTGVIALGGVY